MGLRADNAGFPKARFGGRGTPFDPGGGGGGGNPPGGGGGGGNVTPPIPGGGGGGGGTPPIPGGGGGGGGGGGIPPIPGGGGGGGGGGGIPPTPGGGGGGGGAQLESSETGGERATCSPVEGDTTLSAASSSVCMHFSALSTGLTNRRPSGGASNLSSAPWSIFSSRAASR